MILPNKFKERSSKSLVFGAIAQALLGGVLLGTALGQPGDSRALWFVVLQCAGGGMLFLAVLDGIAMLERFKPQN